MLGLNWYIHGGADAQLQTYFFFLSLTLLHAVCRRSYESKGALHFKSWTLASTLFRLNCHCLLPVNVWLCIYICVRCELKSTFLLCSFFPSASPHHINTVAMATILIDPVPSNTKCFSKPKLKQSGGRQWLAGELTAPAEEHDGSGAGFLSLLASQSYCNQWNKIQIVTVLC